MSAEDARRLDELDLAEDPHDHRRVAAVAVHCCGPEPCHIEANAPLVLAWIVRRLIRNVVAVGDHDRNAGQLLEIGERHDDAAIARLHEAGVV